MRRATGQSMQGHFRREGLVWELNLDEGIDFSIWLFGAFEHDMLQVYSRLLKPGACVLDIGANIGAHTLPLARLVGTHGRVIAIEATIYAYEKLKKNLSLNPEYAAHVTAKHALLVDKSGLTDQTHTHLHSSWPLAGDIDTHPVLGGALKPLGTAQILTVDQLIDELSLPRIDWIKLDVDGNELTVLRGAHQTILRDHPHILLELAPYCHAGIPDQFESLVGWLSDAGYILLSAENLRELPKEPNAILRYIPKNGSINAYAKPVPLHK